MFRARTADRSHVQVAAGKMNLASLHAIHEHRREGVQVFGVESDAAAGPTVGHAELALVPGGVDRARLHVFPGRMRVKRLGILLQIVGDPRPASWHFEETPTLIGNSFRLRLGWLPAPQAVETDPF